MSFPAVATVHDLFSVVPSPDGRAVRFLESDPEKFREILAEVLSESEGLSENEGLAEMLAMLGVGQVDDLLARLQDFLDGFGGVNGHEKQELIEQIFAQIIAFSQEDDTGGLERFLQELFTAEVPQDVYQVLAAYAAPGTPADTQVQPPVVKEQAFTQSPFQDPLVQGDGQTISPVDVVQSTYEESVVPEAVQERMPAQGFLSESFPARDEGIQVLFGQEDADGGHQQGVSLTGTTGSTFEFHIPETLDVSAHEVASLESAAKTEFLTLVKDIVDRLSIRRDADTWKGLIELKPDTLGDTQVRLELHGTKVTLDILVSQAEAKETITNYLSDLRQGLEDQGFALEECSVDVDPNYSSGKSLFSQGFGTEPGGVPEYDQFSTSRVSSAQTSGVPYEALVLDTENVNCFA